MCSPQCLATIKLLTDIEAEYVLIPLGYDFKVAVLGVLGTSERKIWLRVTIL